MRLHVGHLPRIVLGVEAFDDTQRMLFVEKETWPAWHQPCMAFFFSWNVLAAEAAIRTLERQQHDQTMLMAGAACLIETDTSKMPARWPALLIGGPACHRQRLPPAGFLRVLMLSLA